MAEAGCMELVQQELLCHSAPGQSQCLTVGKEQTSVLTGGNAATQYAPDRSTVINGTGVGHVFEDGWVLRHIVTDSLGQVSIMTVGTGVNVAKTIMGIDFSAQSVATINTKGGLAIFFLIGVQNQTNVRTRLVGPLK